MPELHPEIQEIHQQAYRDAVDCEKRMVKHTVGENDELYIRYGIVGTNHIRETEQLCEVVRELENERAKLREELKKIRDYAELTAPDMRLNALLRIEEIVDTALQELF